MLALPLLPPTKTIFVLDANADFFSLQVTSSPKGQVEMILELCDSSLDAISELDLRDDSPTSYKKSLNPFECDDEPTTSRSRFSLSDLKIPNVKRLMKSKREKHTNGLSLKITTSKMRCSIKVKEEFENDASKRSSSMLCTSEIYDFSCRPNLPQNNRFGARHSLGHLEE